MYNKYRKWRNHKRGFAKKMCKLTSTRQSTDVSFFYLCSCLSTQFLYRTAIKATFNVKDNIKDIIKNSITLTINITTLPTKIRKIGGKNHICLFSFPMSVSITYILQQSNKNKQIFVIFFGNSLDFYKIIR